MNNFDLNKLNKYQKGMIIASLIFLISMIGFLFNSRVRISESYVEEPDIIIDTPKDTDPNIDYKSMFMFIIFNVIVYLIYNIYKMSWRIFDV